MGIVTWHWGLSALLLTSVLTFSCSDDTKDDDENTATDTTIISDNAAQTIITNNCFGSGCHNSTQTPNLTTTANAVENKTKILERIQLAEGAGGYMPSGRTWDDAANQDKLEAWLKSK